MTILDEIIAYKRQEVELAKEQMPLTILTKSFYFSAPAMSMCRYLLKPNRTGIIAEFKRRSPSKGWINENADVLKVSTGYNAGAASGLSILTDTPSFGGSMLDLEVARKSNLIPILRKDFIIDEYQVIEAKSFGADLLLLIAAALPAKEIEHLAKVARSIGMEVLLEVHNEEELQKINQYINIVGVNNRNLKTFEVDINLSLELISKIPDQFLKISESGISTPESIVDLSKAGYHGFLIGENFMKSEDPATAFVEFVNTLHEITYERRIEASGIDFEEDEQTTQN